MPCAIPSRSTGNSDRELDDSSRRRDGRVPSRRTRSAARRQMPLRDCLVTAATRSRDRDHRFHGAAFEPRRQEPLGIEDTDRRSYRSCASRIRCSHCHHRQAIIFRRPLSQLPHGHDRQPLTRPSQVGSAGQSQIPDPSCWGLTMAMHRQDESTDEDLRGQLQVEGGPSRTPFHVWQRPVPHAGRRSVMTATDSASERSDCPQATCPAWRCPPRQRTA